VTRVLGIDLGTTNTVVALNGRVRTIGPDFASILPSVVAFPPNGEVLVGGEAVRRRGMDPRNTIFSAKRIIGQRWHSSAAKEFRRRYPFDLEEDAAGFPVFSTRVGRLSPIEIATHDLRAVCSSAEVRPTEVSAVIAVPSLFRDAQVAATFEAGQAAGLDDLRIVREPSATAAAYLGTMSRGIERAAVYDLGGGTFDLAIVDCTKDPFEVIGHGGDIFLGGDDVDLGIAQWLAQEILRTRGWDLTTDPAVYARLVVAAEKAKIDLSETTEATIELAAVDQAVPFRDTSIPVTRERLAALAAQLVRRTFIICDEVLMQVGAKARDIDAVFLAGGATHLEVVREGIEAYFQRPVSYSFDPMHVVAVGASMQGAHDEAQETIRKEA
jgi:molecular chaperone DnaK